MFSRIDFDRKLIKLKKLIASGNYRKLLHALSMNLSNYLRIGYLDRSIKYLYLKRKYSAFIADKMNDKLHNRKENRITETPNIIWWLWLQGEENAPDVCRACLRSLRRWHSDKKIITLDSNNLHEYITLPDYINEKYKRGIIDNTKYSDLVRLQLLIEHGGTWIDATVFCTGRKFEHIMHLPLFIFRNNNFMSLGSSWFMSSCPGSSVLELTRDLHFQYWKDFDYSIYYLFFYGLFKMSAEAYPDEWDSVPFISSRIPKKLKRSMYEDYTEEKMNHFREISDFHKLSYKLDPELIPSEKSIYHHIIYDE